MWWILCGFRWILMWNANFEENVVDFMRISVDLWWISMINANIQWNLVDFRWILMWNANFEGNVVDFRWISAYFCSTPPPTVGYQTIYLRFEMKRKRGANNECCRTNTNLPHLFIYFVGRYLFDLVGPFVSVKDEIVELNLFTALLVVIYSNLLIIHVGAHSSFRIFFKNDWFIRSNCNNLS